MMKRIWPWIALLLLLMILCIVTKIDDIHTNYNHHTISSAADSTQKNSARPIEFDIVTKDNGYRLDGRFRDTAQQQRLTNAFADTKRHLQIGNTSTNQTLVAQEVIVLVEEIIPHFANHYENGSIHFHNNKLTIDGTVHSYEEKRQMEHLLSRTTLPTQDNTVVVLPKKPISFRIDKQNEMLSMHGLFHDEAQVNKLVHSAPNGIRLDHISNDRTHMDTEGAVPFAQRILPLFSEQFTQGYIQYKNHQFVVNGLAKGQAALDRMKLLLAQSKIPIVDQTRIDPAVLQKAAEEEAAKQAREKAEAEARLKAEAEAKAAAEAAHKAEQAAKEAAQKRLLQAEKRRQEAEEAKKNIANLLKVENIEFEVAKASLTPKGRQTVNKLAEILNKYPDIRIEIAGHTDSDGRADFNQQLSQARVDTVKNALIEQGINTTRLEAVGYGETKPLVPNTSAENKQKNRRVEINILGE